MTDTVNFFDNEILFGADPTPGIVAVESAGDSEVTVFRRDGKSLVSERCPLRPVAWIARALPGSVSLAGELDLSHMIQAPGWKEFQQLQKALKIEKIPFFSWNDPAQQYLATTGRTLFKGLAFEDLRRLQLDIETDTAQGFGFSHASRDPIAAIALSDSTGWEEFLRVDPDSPDSERRVLEETTRLILERDPDVIEGHNIFNFDLPFLAARAKVHGLTLNWGRGGLPLASRPSRLQIAERAIQFERFSLHGRHFIDTYLLALHYDTGARELASFGLKAVARHLGVTEPDRVILDGAEIASSYRSDANDFRTYALQDVRETRAVAATLSGSYFFQTQIFPLSYQDSVLRGNATKINALLLREYLRRGHSIPLPPPTEPFEGGMTEIFETGVLRDVWHCDAASLYPSIMLAFDIGPRTDELGIFLGLLRELRSFRLKAKAAMRSESESAARLRLDALQNTFKILINSFYGYLGFGQGNLADFAAAAEVASRGRAILGSMVDWLRGEGAKVIEIDTDGIYFQPPGGATTEGLADGMAGMLPDGIEVEFGRRYHSMFSYKAKNYALLDPDGHVTIKGGALKSRGMEPFLRDYLDTMIRHLLEEKPGEAEALAASMEADLRARKIPVEKLARTEFLQDSPASYQKKIAASSRNRSAAFEVALRSAQDYKAGDQIRYYITGDSKKVTAYEAAKPLDQYDPSDPDENIPYYSDKLHDLAAKFQPFFPKERDLFG